MKLLLPVFLFVLIGCASETEQELDEVIVREPTQTITDQNVSVEVYDYDHILPFLERENDKINVVNFWATWCIPCVAELPYFEKLKQEREDVTVTLISLDFVKQVESSLIPFIIENELKSEVILLDDPNSNEWIQKVDENWSGALPATIIYNNEQSSFYEQSFTFEELEKEVNNLKNK
jgi:thiol-disulfide isomerase/thioredoxin